MSGIIVRVRAYLLSSGSGHGQPQPAPGQPEYGRLMCIFHANLKGSGSIRTKIAPESNLLTMDTTASKLNCTCELLCPILVLASGSSKGYKAQIMIVFRYISV